MCNAIKVLLHMFQVIKCVLQWISLQPLLHFKAFFSHEHTCILNIQMCTLKNYNNISCDSTTNKCRNVSTQHMHAYGFLTLRREVTFNNARAGSSCLQWPANLNTVFVGGGSIREVPRHPLHSQLLSRQTLFFPACQCQEPIMEQWDTM